MDSCSSLLPGLVCTVTRLIFLKKQISAPFHITQKLLVTLWAGKMEKNIRPIPWSLFLVLLYQQHLFVFWAFSVFSYAFSPSKYPVHFLLFNFLRSAQLKSCLFTKYFPTKGDCFYLWTAITHILPSWHLYTA